MHDPGKPTLYQGSEMLWFELTRRQSQPVMVFRISHRDQNAITGMEVADTAALKLLRDFITDHLKSVEDYQSSHGAPRLRLIKDDP